MRRAAVAFFVAIALGAGTAAAQEPAGGLVTLVRVHGNYRTPDDQILGLAGLAIGQRLPAGGVDAARERLRRSGLFVSVDVRARFRTLDETGDVAVIIMVQEIPGSVIDVPAGPPNPIRRIGNAVMLSPSLDYTDGYGFTYGGRASFVHVLGKEGRLSVPLTWGGRRQIALEADKSFSKGLVSRVGASASLSRREHPAFRVDDVRREVTGEATIPLGRRHLSVGVGGGWTNVHFGGVHDHFTTAGARLVVDTRSNPSFPRNAVYASAGWRVFDPESGGRANRYRVDAQGYLGLVGSSVLAVRATAETASAPLPRYEKAMIGGASTLRGFRTGAFAGDNMAAGTVELRVPFNSPMHLGQTGLTVFADAGTAYDHGTALSDATFHYGVGAGWYLHAPLVHLNVDVAYGIDGKVRAHVMAGLRF